MVKVITVKNLTFIYSNGKKILNNITFDIYQGEKVGIIGPNGAGKTTLLFHLNGILQGEGKIKIFNLEMNKKNLNKIRQKVGMVFQDIDAQLFSPTVFEDVSFGPLNLRLSKEEVNKRVKEALKQVGLIGFENREPHHLSIGEKQRVAIASVLSMHPEILILDEPTSNLDPKRRRELLNFLKSLNNTIIVASHDIDFVKKLCSRILLMNNGKIVADDRSKIILNNKALLLKNDL